MYIHLKYLFRDEDRHEPQDVILVSFGHFLLTTY